MNIFWKTNLLYYYLNFEVQSFLSTKNKYYLILILNFSILELKADQISSIMMGMIYTIQISGKLIIILFQQQQINKINVSKCIRKCFVMVIDYDIK